MTQFLFRRMLFLLLPALFSCAKSQTGTQTVFTHADSLRGALRPERTCFDVHFYDLQLSVNLSEQSISGNNGISFWVKEPAKTIQLDLFSQFSIDSIVWKGQKLTSKRDANAVFIDFPEQLLPQSQQTIQFYYHGKPNSAKNAPWDGGFVWKKDRNGNPWVGVACEGHGASSWWPLKDHLSDEPDSMRMRFTIPANLECVSNGTLQSVILSEDEKKATYEWFVSYPINSYNVTLNIGDYKHFSETYESDSVAYELDYYVLSYNFEKAKQHFTQVKTMLQCFEEKFGTYPFWKDGYALVETSYWGMEHQGCIAYGNNYKNEPEWGFDYIIVHESGHEWFGNSVSVPDHAEMWIHESFTTYAEAIYVECQKGYDASCQYLTGQKINIINSSPILGPKDVNFDGWAGSDMYYKGSWMLHTFRSILNDDTKWFETLKKFAVQNRISIINTNQAIDFFCKELGDQYRIYFKAYLESPTPPTFCYKLKKGKKGVYDFTFWWECNLPRFSMPVEVLIGSEIKTLLPSVEPQTITVTETDPANITVNLKRFYVFQHDQSSLK